MCGGALSAACADCADACELAATTRAAVNAASFAIDISSLLPLTRIQFGLPKPRALSQESRPPPADVNGERNLRCPFGDHKGHRYMYVQPWVCAWLIATTIAGTR